MGRRRKSKFEVGETVVIAIYGTVGKVTKIQWLDGTYVYEVNHSEELYKEDSLLLLSEFKGEILEKEHIDIEYKFTHPMIPEKRSFETREGKARGREMRRYER